MKDQIAHSFKVLELSPGATAEEIKKAYRVLVKVWHPDRFPSDKDLQQLASEKIKEINSAYDLLNSEEVKYHQAQRRTDESDDTGSITKVDAFTFYGFAFDETAPGSNNSKAVSANRPITIEFLKIISDWIKERGITLEITEAMPTKFGCRRLSHSDYQQRIILLNSSESLVVSSLIKPIVRMYIRDKLNSVAAGKKDFEMFSKALKDLNWNGEHCFRGESYLRAESLLTDAAADDLIDRLLKEGSASYWADTRALYKISYGKGPHSLQDWGRFVGLRCHANAPYPAK